MKDGYRSDVGQWSDMDHTEAGVWGFNSTGSKGRDRKAIADYHRELAAEQRRLGFPSLAAAHEAQAQEIEEHGA